MPLGQMHQALSGKERLWRVWWLWGIPVALAASALTVFAGFAREDGMHVAGSLLDTLKVLIYAAWLVAAWRCAPNVKDAFWKNVSRAAVALGIVLVSMTA